MQHPIGRHRKPHRSLTARLWALTATALAMALTYVFVPEHPQRERTALTSPPRPRELPPTPARRHPVQSPADFPEEEVWRTRASLASARWESGYRDRVPEQDHHARMHPDPDRIAGALVRPYLPPAPATTSPRVPTPRVPEGDLLAAPARNGADDLGDLAATIRRYLDRIG